VNSDRAQHRQGTTMLNKIFTSKKYGGGIVGACLAAATFLIVSAPLNVSAQTTQPQSGFVPGVASAAGGAAGCAAGFFAGGLISGLAGSAPAALISVPANDITNNAIQGSNMVRDNLMSCLARAVARSMLQQITISTVNWINGGFNGQPSFVQNYQQFFTNVADQAVGSFIQGSDLAFLCSPFKLQVRIAVAQAYLRYAPSCSLTQITNNINGFMNNFSQGGWKAYMAFTTIPMNNPYGAFMYAQAGAMSAAANARGRKVFDLQLGSGFLSTQQESNCTTISILSGDSPPAATGAKSVTYVGSGYLSGEPADTYRVCDVKNVTPGAAINTALGDTMKVGNQSLIDAKTWDESISAIVSALTQQILYQGLSALNNNGSGYQSGFSTTVSSLSAQAAQSLMQQIGNAISAPQQLIVIENQNITSVQTTMSHVQSLQDCWRSAATLPGTDAGEAATALQNASSTATVLRSLTDRLAPYQASLALASTSLPVLAQFMSLAQSTTDITAIQNMTSNFISYSMSGQLPSAATVAGAQLDQAQLQRDLSTIDTTTNTGLAQCHAFQPATQTQSTGI